MSTELTPEVIEALNRTPAVRMAIELAETERLERRRGLVATIATVHEEERRQYPGRAKAEADVLKRVAEAKRALTEAESVANQTISKGRSVAFSLRLQAERAESELRETASPEIAEFLSWVRDQERGISGRAAPEPQTEVTGRSMDGKKIREVVQPAVVDLLTDRLAALRVAREAADALVYEALTAEELTDRIEALKAGIPSAISGFTPEAVDYGRAHRAPVDTSALAANVRAARERSDRAWVHTTQAQQAQQAQHRAAPKPARSAGAVTSPVRAVMGGVSRVVGAVTRAVDPRVAENARWAREFQAQVTRERNARKARS